MLLYIVFSLHSFSLAFYFITRWVNFVNLLSVKDVNCVMYCQCENGNSHLCPDYYTQKRLGLYSV